MSFRWFVYWCSLCGGWAAFAGWALGRWLDQENNNLATAGIKGMCLGLLICLGLGLVDAMWLLSLRQLRQAAPRVLVCVVVGAIGGLLGGVAGQVLFEQQNNELYFILGWGITGLLVGIALGTFDFLRGWVREQDLFGSLRKMRRGVVGGLAGGLLGGYLDWQLRALWNGIFPDKPDLWAPSASGFVLLGLCMGLTIGVAQIVLKEAWVRVEQGFRAGRELLLSKTPWTIGRAESSDIALFGDAAVDKTHAWIWRRGNDYLIADSGSSTGTFVNDERVTEPKLLHSNDLIRVGNAVLRFREGKKK
jgi:hypothetical protein